MSTDRFKRKLVDQLSYIRKSAAEYDQGHEMEAIRIATALRIIFHQTDRCTSLITHLGWTGCEVLSSLNRTFPLGPHTGLLDFEIAIASPVPVRTKPRLGPLFVPLPWEQWWMETVYPWANQSYARRDLVRTAADQDGGTHVDSRLEGFYAALESGLDTIQINPQGLVFDGPAPYDQSKSHRATNAHLAMLRQLAHEVLASARHFKWEL